MNTHLSHKEIRVWRVVSPQGYYFCDAEDGGPYCIESYIADNHKYGTTVTIQHSMTFRTQEKAEGVIEGMKLKGEGFTAIEGFVAFASGDVGTAACILNLLNGIRGIVARIVETHNESDMHLGGFVTQEISGKPFDEMVYVCDEGRFHIIEPTYVRLAESKALAGSPYPF